MSQRTPGLPSLNESRRVRRRQLATGKTTISGVPPKLFLGGLVVLVIFGVFYFRAEEAKLGAERARVLSKQRAMIAELAPRLSPLRDEMEKTALDLGRPSFTPKIDGSAVVSLQVGSTKGWEALLASPGLYLRIPRKDAGSVEQLRKSARESMKDGLTACLVRDSRARGALDGTACKESKDCTAGELCTEYGVCQRPSSPFNMRLVYRAFDVLSDKWTSEVRDAKNELALVAYERGLDSVTMVDVPVAIDVYQRAKYGLVVLDEPPEKVDQAALEELRASGAMVKLPSQEHVARVAIIELPSGKRLATLRAVVAGELRRVGRSAPLSAEAREAEQRQVTSCGLALDIRNQLVPPPPSEVEQSVTSPEPSPEVTPAVQ